MTGTGTGKPGAPRLAVVYCGGCNPQIDRAAVAAALPVDDPGVRPGAVVYLSGCPRACASGHALTPAGPDEGGEGPAPGAGEAPQVVVAGTLVDGQPVAPDEVAAAVTRKLKE
jgi:hypothetical protein